MNSKKKWAAMIFKMILQYTSVHTKVDRFKKKQSSMIFGDDKEQHVILDEK